MGVRGPLFLILTISENDVIHLNIRAIGTNQYTGEEVILAIVESDKYSPDQLDYLINECLKKSLEKLRTPRLDSLRPWCAEISVVLTADEEIVRPSLHLSKETLFRLAEAGTAFDFDPYV